MKVIKLFNVRENDFDEKGNINPAARLYPAFMAHYGEWQTPKETPTSQDEYIGKVKDNIHYDIAVSDDNGISDTYKNMQNKQRAYSAIAYGTKANRGDSRFTRGVFYSPYTKKDEFRANVDKYRQRTGRDDYTLRATHFVNSPMYSGDDYFTWHEMDNGGDLNSRRLSINDDKASVAYSIRDMMNRLSGNETDDGVKLHTLPFVVNVPDDAVVNFNDVMERGYDPWRDFLQEVQVKSMGNKKLLSGIVRSTGIDYYKEQQIDSIANVFKRMIAIASEELETLADNISEASTQHGNYVFTGGRIYSVYRSLQDIYDYVYDIRDKFHISANTCSKFNAIMDVVDSLKKIRGFIIHTATLSTVNTLSEDVLNQVYDEATTAYKLAKECIENLLPELYEMAVKDIKDAIILPPDDYDYNKIHVVSDYDTIAKALDKDFNYDDLNTVSDKHRKFILKDLSEHYQQKARQKNITSACRGY